MASETLNDLLKELMGQFKDFIGILLQNDNFAQSFEECLIRNF